MCLGEAECNLRQTGIALSTFLTWSGATTTTGLPRGSGADGAAVVRSRVYAREGVV